MLIHFPHGTMCSISSKNSRLFVRTCDNSSLKADRLSCLSIHILYHFFRLFALCGVALSNIALWGVALFVLHGFYGAVKETARAPRFASRGAETPRWGVSRARLGESLRVHKKSHCDVLLQWRIPSGAPKKSPCNVVCKVIFCLLYTVF